MATVTVFDIFERVRRQTMDLNLTFWAPLEVLSYVNYAQLEIVIQRPDANAKLATVKTVLGTRQEIPPEGLRLLEVVRNVANGAVITPIERWRLDEVQPTWHSTQNPADTVDHYIFDERFPKAFYLYPCPEAGIDIEIGYSSAPAKIEMSQFDGTDATVIGLDDVYANAIFDYVMFCMYSKNTSMKNPGKAESHLRNFYQSLGVKFQADKAASPINPANRTD